MSKYRVAMPLAFIKCSRRDLNPGPQLSLAERRPREAEMIGRTTPRELPKCLYSIFT